MSGTSFNESSVRFFGIKFKPKEIMFDILSVVFTSPISNILP